MGKLLIRLINPSLISNVGERSHSCGVTHRGYCESLFYPFVWMAIDINGCIHDGICGGSWIVDERSKGRIVRSDCSVCT